MSGLNLEGVFHAEYKFQMNTLFFAFIWNVQFYLPCIRCAECQFDLAANMEMKNVKWIFNFHVLCSRFPFGCRENIRFICFIWPFPVIHNTHTYNTLITKQRILYINVYVCVLTGALGIVCILKIP